MAPIPSKTNPSVTGKKKKSNVRKISTKLYDSVCKSGLYLVANGVLAKISELNKEGSTWKRVCFSIKTADGTISALSEDFTLLTRDIGVQVGDEVFAIGKECFYIKEKSVMKSMDLKRIYSVRRPVVSETEVIAETCFFSGSEQGDE